MDKVSKPREPVAWMYVGIKQDGTTHGPHLVWKPQYMDAMSASKGAVAWPLYTTPPRREWQGLSEEEIAKVWCGAVMAQSTKGPGLGVIGFARAIEAKLKEKNT